MHFKGKIVITDPGYLFREEHWNEDVWGKSEKEIPEKFPAFGISQIQMAPTRCGDWRCTLLNLNTGSDDDVKSISEDFLISMQDNFKLFLSNTEELSDEELLKAYDDFAKQCKIDLDEFIQTHKFNPIYGYFAADAGMCCVAYVDELLAYFPDNDLLLEHLSGERNDAMTIIDDFDGEVEFTLSEDKHPVLEINGSGSHNFMSLQSSFTIQ